MTQGNPFERRVFCAVGVIDRGCVSTREWVGCNACCNRLTVTKRLRLVQTRRFARRPGQASRRLFRRSDQFLPVKIAPTTIRTNPMLSVATVIAASTTVGVEEYG